MKNKLTLLLFVIYGNLYAQVYSYTSNTGGAPNSVAPNCTATNLTRVNGATLPTFPCGSGFSSDRLTLSASYNEANTAVAFTLTPTGTFNLSLTSITARLRRSAGLGANLARFAYRIGSTGGYTDQGIDVSPNSGDCGATTEFTWVFSSTLFVPKTSSITFRVYFFDAGGIQGTAQILDMFVSGTVLPIELINFEATNQSDAVQLHWATASEQNNSHFEIERSEAGIQFESIGRVTGAGSTAIKQVYHFSDLHPIDGYNYYRLRQVDFDGASSLSPVVTIKTKNEAAIDLFPVPVKDRLSVRFMDPNLQLGAWAIYDVMGRIVRANTLPEAQNVTEIDLSDVPKGMYIFQCKEARNQQSKLFIKE